ncbi:PPC domain-containing protein [Halococcus sediminicola]|uniref:PPC domain-containing protein n=1 Tax=Halococcus sediminicola TaxID=1264579 RepID=UPI000678C4E0|nr:PPC domain-containing protein [Halococcus sediminicola]
MNWRLVVSWLLVVAVCLVAVGALSATAAAQYDPVNETEPNDDREGAMKIEKRQFIEGSTNQSDDDWFAFDARADHAIRVTGGMGITSANLALYGPNGEQLGSGSTGGTEDTATIGVTAPTDGTYYVRASGGQEYETLYNFAVATTAPDGFEPNDDRKQATSLESDTTVPGTISNTTNTRDEDWFAVDADAGENIFATVGLDDTGAEFGQNVRVGIYDSSGNRVGEFGSSSTTIDGIDVRGNTTEQFSSSAGAGDRYAVTEPGTYYVRVSSDGTRLTGFTGYNLTVNVGEGRLGRAPIPSENELQQAAEELAPNAQQGREPNGEVADATRIARPTVRSVATLNDTDYFTLDVEEGERISLEATLADGESYGALSVDLRTPDGDTIISGSTVDPGTSATIFDGTAEQSGNYLVTVRPTRGVGPYGLARPNAYALNVEPIPERTPNDASSLVIVGGSPENKVTYRVAYEGSIERSGESHGAPIEDRHVTVDRDVDEIGDGRIDGRLGGGGDAYLVDGEITGLELDGDAEIYLNGEKVDPASLGSVSDQATSSPAPTATSTPTATPSPTPTATPTSTPSPTTTTATPTDGSSTAPLPTGTQTVTRTVTPTAAEPTTGTGTDATTPTDRDGRIVGGATTEGETTSSSGPGFGLVSGLVVIVAVAVFAVRRR